MILPVAGVLQPLLGNAWMNLLEMFGETVHVEETVPEQRLIVLQIFVLVRALKPTIILPLSFTAFATTLLFLFL